MQKMLPHVRNVAVNSPNAATLTARMVVIPWGLAFRFFDVFEAPQCHRPAATKDSSQRGCSVRVVLRNKVIPTS